MIRGCLKCEKDHGKGGCEKNGLIVYPKCKAGYSNFGCCLCRPPKPRCSDYNLNSGIDLSCAKKIKIGDPVSGDCPSGKEKNVGLCYPACRSGYYGVGPVCWGNAPNGWVGCGMGAAKDSKTCATVIFNQVSSVGTIALNIATLGSSGAATTAVKTATTAGKLSKMKQMFTELKTVYEANKKTIDTVKNGVKILSKAKTAYEGLKGVMDTAKDDEATAEDIARNAAELASALDPTGIAGAVAAYTYPKCSKYFKFKARSHTYLE